MLAGIDQSQTTIPNTFFHGLRDDSDFMRSLYILLDTIPNYEPMLELLLKYDVVGQPAKEELKKAYEEYYDEYALSIILAYSIDDNGTYSLKYENLTKNALQKYCPEQNSTFSDVRTFIAWANEYKKRMRYKVSCFAKKIR